MNEQLQQALTDILNSALQAKNFLVSEIPDVIHQLLIYKATFSAISMAGFFLLAAAIFWINKKQFNFYSKKHEENEFEFFDHPELMVNLFQIFLALPLVALWSLDWLMIWLAPKVYLIEYAASLAK